MGSVDSKDSSFFVFYSFNNFKLHTGKSHLVDLELTDGTVAGEPVGNAIAVAQAELAESVDGVTADASPTPHLAPIGTESLLPGGAANTGSSPLVPILVGVLGFIMFFCISLYCVKTKSCFW